MLSFRGESVVTGIALGQVSYGDQLLVCYVMSVVFVLCFCLFS